MPTSSRRTSAFTLVELLVVIAIIGVLVALLLPAVQAARDAARRTHCINNFKQVGLALQNYHSAQKTFPPGEQQFEVPFCNPRGPAFYIGKGWSVSILPYMEQSAIDDAYRNNDPGPYQLVYSVNNINVGAKRVVEYICPSDPQDELIQVGTNPHTGGTIQWYKANVSGIADSRSAWTNNLQCIKINGNGMLMNLRAIRISRVTDGTSKTFMVGEVTGGKSGSKDGWVYVHFVIKSPFWGINGVGTIPGTGVYKRTGDDCFSSYHTGGCHFTFVDGSVQFIRDAIDAAVLEALCTRAGGETINWQTAN